MPNRREFGDFQTNASLALSITKGLAANGIDPEIIVEPTCGRGAFVIAALKTFKRINKIIALDTHEPYVLETRRVIQQWQDENPGSPELDVVVLQANVFSFDFTDIAIECGQRELLILGNPPWVTNAELGTLMSENLPLKSNFKNHKGLDAITGKGNFDIGESITVMMLEAFGNANGHLAFLLKNSVVKNILFDQKDRHLPVSDWTMQGIDSRKEFNASVEASLLTVKLNSEPGYQCTLMSARTFGWVGDKFVSDVEGYKAVHSIDGICPLEWRQGIKHDCSAVMELDRTGDGFINSRLEVVELEEDLVYGLLKSSDLKESVIDTPRKYTIVTQTRVGGETDYIEEQFPKTYAYLKAHESSFDARKSSIYRNKPAFSIFGIGEYSFKPYKVAISGLYKSVSFNLILPHMGKPLMLDDTCYFIGFDSLEDAEFTMSLLNSPPARALIESITFKDAKRMFTKEVLMRVDLGRVAAEMQVH